jgi:Protein of unknown function (DUF1549)/Protein of unknown function (DUF1553)/Planctomycete cytochrome C
MTVEMIFPPFPPLPPYFIVLGSIAVRPPRFEILRSTAIVFRSWRQAVSVVIVVVAGCKFLLATDAFYEEAERFEKEVRPLLFERCISCHSETLHEAGLRLDSSRAISPGSESGPVILPGIPDESRMIKALEYGSEIQMPPDGKLKDDEIEIVRAWIRRGAFWPTEPENSTASAESATEIDVTSQARTHWAFQPVRRPALPLVEQTSWCENPVDRFILSQLEANGIRPSTAADKKTYLRRVSYDLTGLPPTAEELAAFEADDQADAKARVVDRLLASPRYGERWGRHWLDVARYADTRGYVGVDEGDIERREYRFAYAYRDWVIRAFNDDLPYDDFLRQQIAADLLDENGSSPHLAALGYFRVGRVFLENRHDQIDDRIDVLMRGMQGLTVACARCHDHKFDPIPTADYYALYGVFHSTEEPDDAERKMMLLRDSATPRNARVFKRGNPANLGEEVPRQYLAILTGEERIPFRYGSGRVELAHAVASPNNPLTARVWVNRVWGHHFGTPLVDTPSDFGIRTPAPIHQALLDWLSSQWMSGGWSTKRLHRLLVLSNTYAQGSDHRPDCEEKDPQNRLYWRMPRRRLDLEQLRDSMLVASNDVNMSLGGPSQEISVAPYSRRRTVYARVDRQNLPGVFRTFDFANPDGHSAGRFQTVVPQQGLYLLNDPFVIDCARKAVSALERKFGQPESLEVGVDRLYRQILHRAPRADELRQVAEFMERMSAEPSSGDSSLESLGGWERVAHALLMTNEFTFVD